MCKTYDVNVLFKSKWNRESIAIISGEIQSSCPSFELPTKMILRLVIPQNTTGALKTLSDIYDGVFWQNFSIYHRHLTGR